MWFVEGLGVYVKAIFQSNHSESVDAPKRRQRPYAPRSPMMPHIVVEARQLCPQNMDGKPFDVFGLAYSEREIADGFREFRKSLLTVNDKSNAIVAMAKFADVVTVAFTDWCADELIAQGDIPWTSTNGVTFANLCHVALSASHVNTRDHLRSRVLAEGLEFLNAHPSFTGI